MPRRGYCVWGLTLLARGMLMALMPAMASAKIRTCPPSYLKTDDGKIINPLAGENADQPYSTLQTRITTRPGKKSSGKATISDNSGNFSAAVLNSG
jgi:hypothetical protein